MKRYLDVTIPVRHPAARIACGFMMLSAVLRLWYFLSQEQTLFALWVQLYFFADPPVPVWYWLPEISVLCIMAGLLCLSLSLETRKTA